MQNIKIQHNGNGLAIVITGTRAEKNATLNTLYNHGATDATRPMVAPSGEWIVTVSKYRFVRGLASRLEFLSGFDLNAWTKANAKRARELFERRAADALEAMPRVRNVIVRVNPFA